MSVIYENTLIVKKENVAKTISELENTPLAYNQKTIYVGYKHAIITFDSHGDVFEREPQERPAIDYDVYENICLDSYEDGVVVDTDIPELINSKSIKEMIINKLIVPEVHNSPVTLSDVLSSIEYSCELA